MDAIYSELVENFEGAKFTMKSVKALVYYVLILSRYCTQFSGEAE